MDLGIMLICVYVLYFRGFFREPIKFKQIFILIKLAYKFGIHITEMEFNRN